MSFLEELKKDGVVVKKDGIFKTTYDYFEEQDLVYISATVNFLNKSSTLIDFNIPFSECAKIEYKVYSFMRQFEDYLVEKIPEWVDENVGIIDARAEEFSKLGIILQNIEKYPDSEITKRANDYLVNDVIEDLGKYPYIDKWDVFYDRVHSFLLCKEEFENHMDVNGYVGSLKYMDFYPDRAYDGPCLILRNQYDNDFFEDGVLDYIITGGKN